MKPDSASNDSPSDFIPSLPKAELHLHLEGTVDPATLAELSRRHPTPLTTENNRYTNIADSGRVFTEGRSPRALSIQRLHRLSAGLQGSH